MKEEEKLEITLLISGLMILGIFLLIYYNYVPEMEGANFGNSLEKCRPLGGYNEQDWIEHMRHHPLAYKECLSQEP